MTSSGTASSSRTWADPPMLPTAPPASQPAALIPSTPEEALSQPAVIDPTLQEFADALWDDRRQPTAMQMPAEDLGRSFIHSLFDIDGGIVAPRPRIGGLFDLHNMQVPLPYAAAAAAATTNCVLPGGALMEPQTSCGGAWWVRDYKRKNPVPWTEEEHR